MNFAGSARAADDRTSWKGIVVKPSMEPRARLFKASLA